MERVKAREGDEVDRVKWRLLSRCGDPEQGAAERRRKRRLILINKYVFFLDINQNRLIIVQQCLKKCVNLYFTFGLGKFTRNLIKFENGFSYFL